MVNFQAAELHGLLKLSFWGRIEHDVAERLRGAILAATRDSFHDLVWDFSALEHIAPRPLSIVACLFARSVFQGFRPVVVDPDMEMLGLCYGMGLERSVEFVRSEDDAFAYYLEGLKVNYNRLFCQILLRDKYLSPGQLEAALKAYNKHERRMPFGKILTSLGYLSAREVVRVIATQKSYLGEILVEQNIVTKEQLDEILKEQAKTGSAEKLGDVLQRLGLASNTDVYEAIHTQFKRRRRIR